MLELTIKQRYSEILLSPFRVLTSSPHYALERKVDSDAALAALIAKYEKEGPSKVCLRRRDQPSTLDTLPEFNA